MKTLQIVAVSSVQTLEHSEAIHRSAELIRKVRPVNDCLLMVPDSSPVAGYYEGRIAPLGWKISLLEYSWFIVRHLARAVTCDHVMIVQADGFVTTPELWTEEFLEYDLIGAPWPEGLTFGNRVGNCGFSILSRRFLELSAIGPEYEHGTGADIWWSSVAQDYFLLHGMRYAPLELAARFAVENDIPEYPDRTPENCFGQHGRMRLKAGSTTCSQPTPDSAPAGPPTA